MKTIKIKNTDNGLVLYLYRDKELISSDKIICYSYLGSSIKYCSKHKDWEVIELSNEDNFIKQKN